MRMFPPSSQTITLLISEKINDVKKKTHFHFLFFLSYIIKFLLILPTSKICLQGSPFAWCFRRRIPNSRRRLGPELVISSKPQNSLRKRSSWVGSPMILRGPKTDHKFSSLCWNFLDKFDQNVLSRFTYYGTSDGSSLDLELFSLDLYLLKMLLHNLKLNISIWADVESFSHLELQWNG